MALLTVDDLRVDFPDESDETLLMWITDAEAIAAVYAPCITSVTFKHKAAARAIIRKAIKYDVEAQEEGNNVARQATGPHSVEYKTPTRSGTYYSKAQIEALQKLCPSVEPGMYSIQLGL